MGYGSFSGFRRIISFLKSLVVLLGFFLLGACSFDYGMITMEEDYPDLLMQNTEYVRVRDGDPVVRVKAKQVKRYEKRQTMELDAFSFEQFEDHGETLNAVGSAGTASMDLGSGNIQLGGKVTIAVDSEDIIIETDAIEWKDRERSLSGGEDIVVDIYRSDGTSFTGRGFSADLRQRTWIFSGDVEGIYIHDDEKDGEVTGFRSIFPEELYD
ncbi:MAG: LPS export ABC transporter periplasmic protein LptC [Spirochaetaceae bacterium]|jgi:LPS export ABC transporter protein LptC|nr:LPS export ABC transporter periplasmic protein LptC [Spirochaetaceae bacterium]